MLARWLSRTFSYRQRLLVGPLIALLPVLVMIAMLVVMEDVDRQLLMSVGGMGVLLVLPLVMSVYYSIVHPYQLLVEQIKALSPESLASESFVDEHLKLKLDCGHELGELYGVIQGAAKYIQAQHQQIRKQNRRLAHKNKELLTHVQRVTQARQAADRVSAEKDNFIANISHELRTPLSGVVAAVEMIEQTVAQGISSMLKMDRSQMSAPQVQALRASRQEVREILTIIDEILKPSSSSMEIMVDDLLESLRDIAYGDVKLHVAPFSLEKVFAGTARAYEDMAFKKGLIFDHVVVNNSSSHNVFYQSDWTRIGQVLNNLLNNPFLNAISS